MTNPTIVGLAPQVGGAMPAGVTMLTEGHVAHLGSYPSVSAMHADIAAGAPSLPHGVRVGGVLNFPADGVRSWLDGLAVHRLAEPERKALENAEAKRRHEACDGCPGSAQHAGD